MTLRSLRPALLGAALFVLAGCGQSATSSHPSSNSSNSQVALIVNGHPLSLSTYQGYLAYWKKSSGSAPGVTTKMLAERTIQQMIADEVVREYAAAHHLTVSNAEVNAQIALVKKQLGGDSAFHKRLASLNLTEPLFKQMIRSSLLQRAVANKVTPPSAKEQMVAHVRHILIGTNIPGKPKRSDAAAKALAMRVFAQLQHGASFAALAKKYSDDPGSAAQGGDLGTVSPGQMVPQFDHASFTLPIGHPAIVHTMYGYHIIEVLSRGKQPPSAAQQQQAQQQAFNVWVTARMHQAHVKQLVKTA